MEYTKSAGAISGTWIKGSDVKSGVKAKLLAETMPRESQFKNEDGTPKMQDVSKIKFQDKDDTYNVALNRATIDGLVEAFGGESRNWVGKVLTAQTEKMIVAGRSVRALYLVPDGFEVSEDENGYMTVSKSVKDDKLSDGSPMPDFEIAPGTNW